MYQMPSLRNLKKIYRFLLEQLNRVLLEPLVKLVLSCKVFYPEGAPPFYDQLAEQYGYPAGVDPLSGPRRFDRPRPDLPTPQELRDTRQHMLASALTAMEYGPRTAQRIGDINEIGANRLHQAMDKRNNAVGISLFKQAGINATPAQIAQMVDKTILDQLNTILNRPAAFDRDWETD